MISRISTVWARDAQNAEQYTKFLNDTIFPSLRGFEGYKGAYLLRRSTDKGEEFVIVTMWDSLDAIRAFAGDDIEAAVFEPEATRLLYERDERVKHYEVVLESR